jgi:hypothetical protein
MMKFFAVRSALVIALTVGTLSVCIDSVSAEEIENPTEEQKIMLFLKQISQDFNQLTSNASDDNPLNVSGIDQAHFDDYEQFCMANQVFSVAYPIQIQKVKKRIFAILGQKKGVESLAGMDLDSGIHRNKACALAYAQFAATAMDTTALAALIEQDNYDEAIKLVKKHQGILKKFQGVRLAETKSNVLHVLLQETEKTVEERLSVMEQAIRTVKLKVSENKK